MATKKSRQRRNKVVGVVVILVLAIGGGLVYLSNSDSNNQANRAKNKPSSSSTTALSTVPIITTTVPATPTTLLTALPCGGAAGAKAAFDQTDPAQGGFSAEVTMSQVDNRWALVVSRPVPGSPASSSAGFTLALCQDDNWRAMDFGPLEDLPFCSAPPAAVKQELCR